MTLLSGGEVELTTAITKGGLPLFMETWSALTHRTYDADDFMAALKTERAAISGLIVKERWRLIRNSSRNSRLSTGHPKGGRRKSRPRSIMSSIALLIKQSTITADERDALWLALNAYLETADTRRAMNMAQFKALLRTMANAIPVCASATAHTAGAETPSTVTNTGAASANWLNQWLIGDGLKAAELFHTLDVDGNGLLDPREFAVGWAVMTTTGSASDKLDRLFRLFDRKGTGYVSRRNFRRVLRIVYAVMDPGALGGSGLTGSLSTFEHLRPKDPEKGYTRQEAATISGTDSVFVQWLSQ